MKDTIIIITGERGEGKTSFCLNLVREMKASGLKVAGMLAPGTWKNNDRNAFFLEDIVNGERMLYCQRKAVDGWEKIRKFYINPEGDDFANKVYHSDRLMGMDVVFLDEIGPFELEGKGWSDQVVTLLNRNDLIKVLVIRSGLVKAVTAHFNMQDYNVYRVSESSVESVLRSIKSK